MKMVVKITNALFPVIIWMALIFYFSSRESIGITETLIFDFIIFKTLHIIEYAILYFLLYRAFSIIQGKKLKTIHMTYAFLIALIYAVIDELHQTFVPTREGRLRDVFIDMIGIGGMIVIIKRLNFLRSST